MAGKYRDMRGAWHVTRNIEAARAVARELWLMGFAVICPHSNTALMDGIDTGELFLDGDLAILERCDFIVMLPGWQESSGATAELEHARALGLGVFIWPDDREALDTVAAEPPACLRFPATAERRPTL